MRTSTRGAVAALAAMTADPDVFGPEWLQAVVAVIQFLCTLYVLVYVITAPEPRRRKVER